MCIYIYIYIYTFIYKTPTSRLIRRCSCMLPTDLGAGDNT